MGILRGEGACHPATSSPPPDATSARARHPESRGKTIAFDEPGVELDLGGIAKGYAVDRVIALLKERQITAALVSSAAAPSMGSGPPAERLGRDAPGSDRFSENSAHRHPEGPGPLRRRALGKIVRVRRRTVFAHHGPAHRLAGARRAERRSAHEQRNRGDALDDAFFVMGPERSRAYLKTLPRTEALFFLPEASGWKLVKLTGR